MNMSLFFWSVVTMLSMAGFAFAIKLWRSTTPHKNADKSNSYETALKRVKLAQDLALMDLYTFKAQEMILEALAKSLTAEKESDE